MAFLTTSDSIVVFATLTDKGKKLLARGNFKVAKFALGDDEIDYSLFDPAEYHVVDEDESAHRPALLNTKLFEAFKVTDGNIQYGLDSYDDGVLYLTAQEIAEMGENEHAALMYLPILKSNNKLSSSPTMSGSYYYLSANDETTAKLDSIEGFKFLSLDRVENVKLIVESGIDVPHNAPEPDPIPTRKTRRDLIIKNHLLKTNT